VLLVAGAAIAPTYAVAYALAGDAAPHGTVTEAFSWLATAIAIGASIGAAGGGILADHAGPATAFALAGGAGLIALLTTALRFRTLAPPFPAIA
jgi:MFS family permease